MNVKVESPLTFTYIFHIFHTSTLYIIYVRKFYAHMRAKIMRNGNPPLDETTVSLLQLPKAC